MIELGRSRATWMMGLALAAAGCGRSGGGDSVCHAAAELCGASGDFDEDSCTGDEREFAECLVDRGDCEPLTAAECAGDVEGPDGGPSPGGSIELDVVELAPTIDRLDVTIEIRNVSVSEPIPVNPGLFLLEDDAHNLHVSLGGVCDGGDFLGEGGRQECQLQYPLSEEAEPVQIVYRDPGGRTATASLAGECAVQPEATLEACTDRCSNDGDEFIDCEDFDCCDVPGLDCPPDTACGEPTCLPGLEDTLPLCTDQCSNDDDTYVDCEDFDCCDVPGLDCPPTSACGMRGLR